MKTSKGVSGAAGVGGVLGGLIQYSIMNRLRKIVEIAGFLVMVLTILSTVVTLWGLYRLKDPLPEDHALLRS